MTTQFKHLSERIIAARFLLWSSLITVHSVLLAVAFALAVAPGKWGGWWAVALGLLSFTGMLLALANIVTYLAQTEDLLTLEMGQQPSKLRLRWMSVRLRLWRICEIGSAVALLLYCAALLRLIFVAA